MMIGWVSALLVGLAAAADAPPAVNAYTPQLQTEQPGSPQPAVSTVHKVACNDPEVMNDCHVKAHKVCGGAFTTSEEDETDHRKGGNKHNRIRKQGTIPLVTEGRAAAPSQGDQRTLEFTCGKPPSAPSPLPTK